LLDRVGGQGGTAAVEGSAQVREHAERADAAGDTQRRESVAGHRTSVCRAGPGGRHGRGVAILAA